MPIGISPSQRLRNLAAKLKSPPPATQKPIRLFFDGSIIKPIASFIALQKASSKAAALAPLSAPPDGYSRERRNANKIRATATITV
jgi:hypothetical protein